MPGRMIFCTSEEAGAVSRLEGGSGRTDGRLCVSARGSPALRANLISRAEQLFLPRRILGSHQILDSITSRTATASRAATAEMLLRVPAAGGAHLQPLPLVSDFTPDVPVPPCY